MAPSSVAGRPARCGGRMPSRTSAVRLSPRPSRSSTSTTRTECSLWWNSAPWARRHAVERLLAGVAERRMAEVVAERDRLGQVLVQPERPRHGPRDPRHLEGVGHARAEVVALGGDEHLRLVLEAAEGLGVDDPVAVALERRSQRALALVRMLPSAGLVRPHRPLRQRRRLEAADAFGEGGGDGARGCGIWSESTRAGPAPGRAAVARESQMITGTVPPSALHAEPVT